MTTRRIRGARKGAGWISGVDGPRSGASRVACAFLVYVLPPVPRCSDWASSSLISPSRNSLPRNCSRVGLHIVLFEDCSAFTRVAARTLARSPICDQLHRRLQPFRYLHDCSGCFRLERSPGGARTHWKTPPCHGAHVKRSLRMATVDVAVKGRRRYCARVNRRGAGRRRLGSLSPSYWAHGPVRPNREPGPPHLVGWTGWHRAPLNRAALEEFTRERAPLE